MRRREFIEAVLVLPAVVVTHSYNKLEKLTWKHRPLADNVTVWLEADNVTNRCVWVNERKGSALMYRHNEKARPYASGGSVVKDLIRGAFRVELKPTATAEARQMYTERLVRKF